MKFSELPREELRSLKVGDLVRMQRANADEVIAPIIHIEHRWGTDALPLVTLEGHDERWSAGSFNEMNRDACRQAGAHMVMEVIERAPYRVTVRTKRNIFAEHRAKRVHEWNWPRKDAPKGQLRGWYGEMDELFMFALGALPFEIVTALHSERAMSLWAAAGHPGLVRRPDSMKDLIRMERQLGSSLEAALAENEHWFVNEKRFCRFVQQNWSRLVMTKVEMNQDADEWQQELADSYSRDLFGEHDDDHHFAAWHDPEYEPMDDPNHPNYHY